ncbi:MAG: hypothetical protein OER80_11915 [Gammaproteobacteria bacterium]|nr:hypothetical protein [Gammaproteobacteria bacterium]MDH3768618.1 hypothetical protein [Gammaproteobacteria bacterium]
MLPLITHLSYLAISIGLTIWVAHTLSSNGLAFLRDSFAGNEELARSINHLLVVGFYLLNLGYVLLTLRRGGNPANITHAVEILATRIGWVLLVLGGMHLGNMYIFNRWRRHAVEERRIEETESVRRRAIRSEAGL